MSKIVPNTLDKLCARFALRCNGILIENDIIMEQPLRSSSVYGLFTNEVKTDQHGYLWRLGTRIYIWMTHLVV